MRLYPTKLRSRNFRAFLVALFLLQMLLSGCFGIEQLTSQIDETTQKTVAVLDNAINSLANQSADWRTTLQDAQDKLTDSAQSTVRNEISNTLQRAEQAAATEIRCIIDFVGVRVQEALIRIKAKLLDQSVDAPTPVLCGVTPQAIDMSYDPTRRNLITLDGYNFDTTPPIQVFLVDSSQNGTLDVSSSLDVQTHYSMTLNLGDNGVHITSTSQKLILKWKNTQLSSIPIIRTTPRCKKIDTSFTPTSITFRPVHTGGDTEFNGHGPDVHVTVIPVVTATFIGVVVHMSAVETGKGDTVADGSDGYKIWPAPPGQKIVWVSNTAKTDWSYIDTDTIADPFNVGVGYVSQLIFIGDTAGSQDAGINTQVTVIFRELHVQLEQTSNCTDTA